MGGIIVIIFVGPGCAKPDPVRNLAPGLVELH